MDLSRLPVSAIWQGASQASHDSNRKPFLLIVLHGRGDSSHGFTWLQSELNLPELNLLLLNAPDSYYGGYSWYDLPPNQLPGILRSRILLASVMKEVERQGFSPEQCLLLGFSQGCLMTIEFGTRSLQPLTGYIGISGYVYDVDAVLGEASPAVKKAALTTGNWLITHGTEDELLPVERTRAQIKALNAGGFSMDYREYKKGHTIQEGQELSDIRAWIAKKTAKKIKS